MTAGWNLFDDAAKPDLQPLATYLAPLRPFDPKTAAALTDALGTVDTAPTTIEDADRAQAHIIDVLRAHDHLSAAFLAVYHGITVAVNEAIEAKHLRPRAFFSRLDGKFAERHFDGLKAEVGQGNTTDAARYGLWRPSFAFDNMDRADGPLGIKPAMAHFTVGMCCHINFDLATSLDETIRELGFADDPETLAEIERGHNYVDLLLTEAVERSMDVLAAQFGCPMSKKIIEAGAAKTVGAVSMAMIRRWRAKTFVNAMQLCRAKDETSAPRIRPRSQGGAGKDGPAVRHPAKQRRGPLRHWLAPSEHRMAPGIPA